MLQNETIYLVIAGTRYTGWKNASISKSIESCCGKFTFTLVTSTDIELASLIPGAPAQVYIGRDLFINGYIDKVKPTGQEDGLTYVIEGRDKTEDIIDCSCAVAPFKWSSITLMALATKLCSPYNILVSKSGEFTDLSREVVLDIGETTFEVLSKAAKARNVLIMSDSNGNIVIGKPGTDRLKDSLVYGKNMNTFTGDFDNTDRFYKYIVKGQKSNKGDPWNTTNLQIHGEAFDEEVRKTRVKILTSDNAETNATAKSRAVWEAIKNAANSESIEVSVTGFRQSDGTLWKHNYLTNVLVDTKAIYINTEMLVSGIDFSSSDSGNLTKLTLKRKDAYTEFVRAKVKKPKGASGIDWSALLGATKK